MANALIKLGRAAEAMAYLPRVQRILSESLGPKHSDVGEVLDAIGDAQQALGKPVEAAAAYAQALDIELAAETPDPNLVAHRRFMLARALPARERTRARKLAEQARDGFDAQHADD